VPGQYVNVGRVTAQDPVTGKIVLDDDLSHHFVPTTAKVRIEKAVNALDPRNPTEFEDADGTAFAPVLPINSTAVWTYLAFNDGLIPVGPVSIRDDAGTPSVASDDFTPTFVDGD